MTGRGIVWNPPFWYSHGFKHFPIPNASWTKIVSTTGERNEPARYHPNLTIADINRIEMECVNGLGFRILPDARPHVRAFWQELPDLGFPVGASNGEETSYIYVEYDSSGPVHGRPMTAKQLKQKGAAL